MFVMCCWKIASLNIIGLWKKQRAVSGNRSSVLCTGCSQTLLHCPCKCRKLLWAVLLNVDFLRCTLVKTPDQMATYNFIYLLVTIFVCMGCDLLILYKTCKELQVSNALWLLGTELCVQCLHPPRLPLPSHLDVFSDLFPGVFTSGNPMMADLFPACSFVTTIKNKTQSKSPILCLYY